MIFRSHPREKLSEFLDETLEPFERETVAAHLNLCAECAQITRELANVRAALREMAPAPAPASLRQNVRAALQNEAKNRVSRLVWGWGLTQFAWTGTLALSALTLMVLARPFLQTPQPQTPLSQTPVSAESSPDAPSQKPGSLQHENRLPTSKTGAPRPKIALDKPIAPVKSAPPRLSSLRRNQPEQRVSASTNSASPNSTSKNTLVHPPSNAPDSSHFVLQKPPTAPAMRVAPGRNNALANQTAPTPNQRKATTSPVETANSVRNTPSPTPFSVERSRIKTAPSQKSKMPRVRQAPTQNAGQSIADQDGSSPASTKLGRTDSPTFTLTLTATSTVSSFSEQKNAASDSASPRPNSQNALENRSGGVSKRAAAGLNPPELAPKANLFRAPSALRDPQWPAAEAKTSQALDSPATSTIARRFRLQIEAPRTVKNAQVRLELPPGLRLLWPASKVIWRGDFTAGQTVTAEFSLSRGRGEEKISVVLEQKSGDNRSNILETQTLVSPASMP